MTMTTDQRTPDKGRVIIGGVGACRGLRWSLLLGSCLALAVAGRPAIGQDLDVSGGTITGNSAATTFDRIFVSGTAADGTRSTYNADATLTVNDHVSVFDAGIFNVNAPVTVGSYILAGSSVPGTLPSGSVRLNTSGTLAASQGYFAGPGSLVQAGGNYSLEILSLANAGTIDYQASDSITAQVDLVDSTLRLGRSLDVSSISLTGSVAALETNGHTFSTTNLSVGSGAAFTLTSSGSIKPNGTVFIDNGALTLDRDISGLFQTQLIGSGATIAGTGRYETVNLFASNGADVPYRAGDAITNFASVSDATITVTGTTLATGALFLSGSTATVAGTGNYSVQTLSLSNGATLVFDAADSVSGIAWVTNSTLVLDADLVTDQINLSGSTAALTGTGSYSTSFLVLSQVPAFTYRVGDSITGDVFLYDSVLTIDKALELTGGLTLSGPAAGLVGPHDYRVGSLSLSNSSLSYDGGDSITTAVVVSSGTLAVDKDLALTNSLTLNTATLSGSGRYAAPNVVLTSSTLAYRAGDSITSSVQLFADAALVLESSLDVSFISLTGTSTISGSGTYTAAQVFLSDGSTLAYRTGDTITQTVSIVDSQFTLEGDLVVANSLLLSGSTASLSGPGRYATPYLGLTKGATLGFRSGDAVSQMVDLSDATLVLDSNLVVQNVIQMSGSTAALTGAGSYTTPSLLLFNQAALAYDIGDSITGAVTLFDSVLTLNRDLALAGTLNLSGSAAGLAGTGAYSAQSLFLDNASLTFSSGDAIANTVSLFNGVLTLDTALSLGGQLSLNGPLAAISGTGLMAVNGLTVANGAAVTARAGDSITGDVFLQSGGDLVAQTPLGLRSLLIDAGVGSVLTLQSFTGTGPVNRWGLALDGDRTAEIGSFLADGRILSPGAPDGVTTIFDAGSNRTFLVAVPEPTTLVMAAIAAAAALFRRRRTVRTR
jgi:hypothetical protein